MATVESICADLGITIIPCNVTLGPMLTRAPNVLRGILAKHGEGHLILVLRTIVESEGNEAMLVEPVIYAISNILAAHPAWGECGLAWLEAFDSIKLKELAATAKANRRASPASAAIATMLHERLSPLFDPPPKPKRQPKAPYVYKRGPRKPKAQPEAVAA
jgi:hypothetical protein